MIDITQRRYQQLLEREKEVLDYRAAVQEVTRWQSMLGEELRRDIDPEHRQYLHGQLSAFRFFNQAVSNAMTLRQEKEDGH
jgi:hypothetical protein